MKKRFDKNSATSAVAGFVGAINDRIPLPAGVELLCPLWIEKSKYKLCLCHDKSLSTHHQCHKCFVVSQL